MATYTRDGEVYDAEDDEISFSINEDHYNEMCQREQRELEILKVHPFLVNRIVIVKDSSNTRRKGWRSEAHHGKKGKQGRVVEVHDNVTEAVKIQFGPEDRNPHFWHYKDLMLVEVDDEPTPPVLFNPMNLVV